MHAAEHRETYSHTNTAKASVTVVGSLIENVNALTCTMGEDTDCGLTTFRPSTTAMALHTSDAAADAVVIDNADAGSFGSGSFDDIEDHESAPDPSVLQDADTIDLQDTDDNIIIVMQQISIYREAEVLQVADIHSLEDASPHVLQDTTADIEVKNPQLGTVETLYDACTIDHHSSISSSVDCHMLNLDADVSSGATEQDNSGDVTVALDGDDYVVEVLI